MKKCMHEDILESAVKGSLGELLKGKGSED